MENYSLLVGNFEADSHLILIRLTAAHTHSLPSSYKSHPPPLNIAVSFFVRITECKYS
jgi:hypothetical protein